MTQAERIIAKCGGISVVSEMTGVNHTRVYRWQITKARGGTGGLIPSRYHQTILDAAKARGVDLTPADFFPAAMLDEPAKGQAA